MTSTFDVGDPATRLPGLLAEVEAGYAVPAFRGSKPAAPMTKEPQRPAGDLAVALGWGLPLATPDRTAAVPACRMPLPGPLAP